MLKMIPLGLQGIDILVLDLPATPSRFDQVLHILFRNEVIGDESGSVGDFTFIICYAELNPVDLERMLCIHEWDPVDIAVEEA